MHSFYPWAALGPFSKDLVSLPLPVALHQHLDRSRPVLVHSDSLKETGRIRGWSSSGIGVIDHQAQ